MKVTRKINGRVVTERQWQAHFARRASIFGDPCERMLAECAPPPIRTNDTFMRGKRTNSRSYYGQLADFPGDERAWCADDSDVLRRAKELKIKIELKGVTHDFREKYTEIQERPYRVADDLVQEEVAARLEETGPLPATELSQLTEQVRREITPGNL